MTKIYSIRKARILLILVNTFTPQHHW